MRDARSGFIQKLIRCSKYQFSTSHITLHYFFVGKYIYHCFFFVIANTTSTFMIYTMEYNIAAFCHLHYPLLSVKSSIMLSSVNKFVLPIHNISVYREIWFPAASFVFIQPYYIITIVDLIQYKNELQYFFIANARKI